MTVTELPADRLQTLESKLDVLLDEAAHRRRQRESIEALLADVAPIGPDVLSAVTDRLARAEEEGYFELLRKFAQPEMVEFASRMVDSVRAEQDAVAAEPEEPPGLLALARQLRDPDVRRGIARALHTLRAVSVETGPHPTRQGDTP